MRFFSMKQDRRLRYGITFRDFNINGGGHLFKKEDYSRLNDSTVLFLSGKGDEVRPDFIQSPVQMISDGLKSIFCAYEDELLTRQVILIHPELKVQYRYHMLLMDELDARIETGKDEIVLDSEKIGCHHMFQLPVDRIRTPFVSLAVAESLLRRNVSGVVLEEVEVR